MRVLGLDLGSKRIGLALSDTEGRLAFPEGALVRRKPAEDLAALETLCRERGVEEVVLGLPLHMSGRAGPEAEAARRFAETLSERLGLPVALVDERWTSVEAERTLRMLGEKPSKRKGRVDEMAATLILRSYLEQRQARAERGA